MDKFKSLGLTYSKQIQKESVERRKFNIDKLSKLTRTGLKFGTKERKLLLHVTDQGEKIYIQYPGKETILKDKGARPWDFRPKIKKANGTYLEDLSFKDIWDDISQMKNADEDALCILSAIFFRMSLMIDYTKTKQIYNFITYNPNLGKLYDKGKLELEWYKMDIPKDIIQYLDSKIGKIRGVSIEAYLYYNDLLAQNEDCKYFYRDKHVKGKKWVSKTGRRNTMLTHMSVIEYLEDTIKFSDIMNRFQNGRGVGPIPIGNVQNLTKGLII